MFIVVPCCLPPDQDYHGIKDDDDELVDDPIITSAIRRARRGPVAIDDDDPIWAVGYRRCEGPSSAPSRRSSVAVVPSHFDYNHRTSMLRATRSYGHVEVHGLQRQDRHRVLARHLRHLPSIHRPGSTGSTSTTNHRPLSQTTLTSYLNDGGNNLQTTREPSTLVTVDM